MTEQQVKTLKRTFVLLLFLQCIVYSDYYSLNGSKNNEDHPEWGITESLYRRLPNEHNKLSYVDGYNGINSSLPNVRLISNAIGQIPKTQSKYDKYAPLSGIAWEFSKTLSQDLCHTQTAPTPNTFHPIKVPPCDWYWDINCTNQTMMPFWRSPYKNTTSDDVEHITYPTPINIATAFIDLHFIYGLSVDEQNKSRLFRDGLIKTTNVSSDNLVNVQLDSTGHTTVDTYNSNITNFYHKSDRWDRSFGGINASISGYTATECPFFAGSATSKALIGHLWKLNHNRIARELAIETGSTDDEYLFQEARTRQIATAQHIIYTEYLALFLAYPIINDIQYDPSIDPTVSTWYCGLAHKYSHPATPNNIPFGGYHDDESKPIYGGYINEIISSISIRDAVTYPCMGIDNIRNNNQTDNVYMESMLGGLMLESENFVAPKHNEFLRSFLQHIWYNLTVDFDTIPSHEGMRSTDGQMDLFATDILRARDWGMPSYNDARELFNLSRIESWENLTDNEWYLEVLPRLYDNIDDLDAYVGGLLEKVEADYADTRSGSGHVGPLFAAMLRDQYRRSAAGDRLFYIHNETLKNYTSGLTLSKIIELNTNLKNLSIDIFTADSKSVYNTQTSETHSVTLLNDAIYFEWSINDEDKSITFTFKLSCDAECEKGWMAIGWGEGEYMKGKDIIKMNFDQQQPTGKQFTIIDSYCPNDRLMPLPDPDDANGQDVTLVSGSFDGGSINITFKRPLNKHGTDGFSAYDYPIKKGLHCCSIVAYHLGYITGKHATNHRTPVIVDWYTGENQVTQINVVSDVRLTHGIFMTVLFGICYPLSAFMAHYLKHYPWARYYHMISANVGLTSAFTSAFFAVSTVVHHMDTVHGSLGITCLVLLCAQGMIGYVISYWLDNYKRSIYYDKIKYMHLFIAICILFISPVTVWKGWERYGMFENKRMTGPYGFFIFYILVILLLIIGELYIRFWPKYASNQENVFNVHNYHIFKWSEIGEKVSGGAAWIIIDGLIFDVTEWQYSHPGGRHILLHYLGTDCSAFFNGNESVGDAHGNIKHTHTAYAKKQMLNIIVGEVYCDKNRTRNLIRRNTGKGLLFDVEGDVLPPSSPKAEPEKSKNPRKLRVCRLINKVLLSKKKGERKIMLFEFDYDVIEHNIGFNGDYILLHEADKNTICRAYTPINPQFILCNNSKYYNKNEIDSKRRLFLMIRIYKNGKMSKILNKLKVNHTMRITGPFQREKLLRSRPGFADNIIPNEEWINKWLIKLVNNNATSDEIDLARNELRDINIDIDITAVIYWRRMICICGGTGVTPMFNMIQHHLERDDNDIRIHLIWHNRTLNDVCFEKQLKYYRDRHPNRFWIDLKFDDELVNKDRLKWARLHTKKWDHSDMIEMVLRFLKNGVPINMDKEINSQRKLQIKRKDNIMYSSVEMDTENEDDDDDDDEEQEMKYNDNDNSNDVIILSGPRPFIANIQKVIYHKKRDLIQRIICLD